MRCDRLNQVSPWVWQIASHFLFSELTLENPTSTLMRHKINNTVNYHLFILLPYQPIGMKCVTVLPLWLMDTDFTLWQPGAPDALVGHVDQCDFYSALYVSTHT